MTHYEHFTLDIETLSTEPNAVVLSFALVAFDPNGTLPNTVFHERFLHLDEQFALGRDMSESTLLWWMAQLRAPRKQQERAPRGTCGEAVMDMVRWLRTMTGEGDQIEGPMVSQRAKIWGNGKDFDVVILGDLARQLGFETPWLFRNARCFRDLYLQHPDVTTEVPNLIKHSAEHDALWEAEHIKNIVATKGITLY